MWSSNITIVSIEIKYNGKPPTTFSACAWLPAPCHNVLLSSKDKMRGNAAPSFHSLVGGWPHHSIDTQYNIHVTATNDPNNLM